jgi:predicted PurR-regulated permease PerM
MIRSFLMAIFMAGIFSALAQPIYLCFVGWYRGRRNLASLTTLFLIVIIVILPLGGLMGIITAQAIKVGQSVTPWVQKQISEPGAFNELLEDIPLYDRIAPYQETILRKAGEMVGSVSSFLINSLSSATVGTVSFLFTSFILLYTMFFFLVDGEKLLTKILYYLPLQDHDERRILEKFTSVTRATLKGTAVIGILQGDPRHRYSPCLGAGGDHSSGIRAYRKSSRSGRFLCHRCREYRQPAPSKTRR